MWLDVSWWDKAIFDSSALITLDHLLQDHPAIGKLFERVRALEASFTDDKIWPDQTPPLRERLLICELPPEEDLNLALRGARLPRSLAMVDRFVYGASVCLAIPAVTGDIDLARQIIAAGQHASDMATILKELTGAQEISERQCENMLVDLAARKDFIIGTRSPTWELLKRYRFPPD